MPGGRLDHYVTVSERIASATPPELAPIQSVKISRPQLITEVGGFIRARVTLADGRTADGTASFRLDLTGKGAQATNPVEDCETSAVGRALAFLGYHADRGIASREEVQEAQRRAAAPKDNGRPAPAQDREPITPEAYLERAEKAVRAKIAAGDSAGADDILAKAFEDAKGRFEGELLEDVHNQLQMLGDLILA